VLASIQQLLDRAQTEKPSIAKMADKVAAWFVGFLLILVTAVGLWWWQHDPDQAFWIALSLLVVTCPCALSLATPAAMTAATGSLTRLGVLTTRGHALETLAKVTHVVFDKTGTLTQGRLALESVNIFTKLTEQQSLNIAAALELGSEHPIAKAFLQKASSSNSVVAKEIEAIPGQGVTGLIDDIQYRLGSASYVENLLDDFENKSIHSTEIFLTNEKEVLAVFFLSDVLREQAAESVQALKALGKTVWLVSGDNEAAVSYIAKQVGIEVTRHSMKPEDKLEVIHGLQNQGEIVAMIGDGVNDAPVLAAAQVSIAMGGGTQLAQASADMVLLSEHLPHLVDAINMAKRSVNIVHQNLGWALFYNLLALPLASMGYIAPWMAAIGMSASSLVVVMNALRLNKSVDM
jgi:Cu2+-exporting ATPase